MKEKSFEKDLEAVHQNAVDMRKTLIEILQKDTKDLHYDNIVNLVIVDGNDTWLSGKLSYIEINKEEGVITFSNFRNFKNNPMSIMSLARYMNNDDISNFDLFDLSVELYNEKSVLYTSAHVTKVYLNPMGQLCLTNEENKNLKF